MQGQPHQHFCAAAAITARQPVKQIYTAPMVLEYFDNDRQAEPGPFGSRRHIGFDEAMPILARKTFTAVRDANLSKVRSIYCQSSQYDALALIFPQSINSFRGILKYIRERLRHKPTIKIGQNRLFWQLLLESDVGAADPHQKYRLPHTISEIVLHWAS